MERYRTFPVLYKKSTTGKIEQWEIWISVGEGQSGVIHTRYGELNGKLQEPKPDVVSEGKNIGKKNETTPLEQANAEAESKHLKQRKSGYVDSLEDAQNDKLDSIIEGGILPMLAQKWEDHASKVVFPCVGQPKLDGIRCVAVKKGNDVTLWSRERLPILSCPHIADAIKERFSQCEDLVLDGELYNHELKADFEKIVSAVRKGKPSKEARDLIQYHLYDVADKDLDYESRSSFFTFEVENDILKFVPSIEVNSADEVMKYHDEYADLGYEGLMLRNLKGKYENKRSYNLQKVKVFTDTEFEIIGVEGGRGKLQGLLGKFVCKTEDGKEFRTSMNGSQEESRKYMENPEEYIGKMLTVKHFGWTNERKPRIPKGLRIREPGL